MDHRAAAEFVVQRLRTAVGDAVARVILYGSVARGEQGPGSDVDLLVVARDFPRVYSALTPILAELLAQGAPLVAPLVVSEASFRDLQARDTWFYANVARDGEALLA